MSIDQKIPNDAYSFAVNWSTDWKESLPNLDLELSLSHPLTSEIIEGAHKQLLESFRRASEKEIDHLWAGLSMQEQEIVGRNRFIESVRHGLIGWGGKIELTDNDSVRASIFLGLTIANKSVIDLWLRHLDRLNNLLGIVQISVSGGTPVD